MSKYTTNQLTLSQFVIFIYKTQIGVGVLTLPRLVSENANRDGWISVILGIAISLTVSILIIKIMEKHPEMTLYDILPLYFGKWLGRFFIFIWIAWTLAASTTAFLATIFITQMWLLPKSSSILIGALFLVPIYLTAKEGVRNISSFFQFVFLSTIWMEFTLLYSGGGSQILNFLPIGADGITPIIKGALVFLPSCFGFEIALFLYPFLKNKKQAIKGVLIAHALTFNISFMLIVLCFLKYSQEEIQLFVFPTLNLLKEIQLPFIERLEIPFLAIYLMVMLSTAISYLYISLFGMAQFTQKRSHIPFLWIAMVFWLIILFSVNFSFRHLQQVERIWQKNIVFIPLVFPILLLIYIKIHHFVQQRRHTP
ncbi:GerAB/ArcD/ProY family transporter [Marininema halotolerans]|uniref:Spore germination protein (Amino acid permease) n=1 Tax=Marininema halotolerans TaxID=1155944 RepID=A0A1I6TLJ1_9BACL|nr:endospore germination permease [Marininema halotolerans]SFS90044.1 spore germination protein (amino acid permease) [Marininema halotolerans]